MLICLILFCFSLLARYAEYFILRSYIYEVSQELYGWKLCVCAYKTRAWESSLPSMLTYPTFTALQSNIPEIKILWSPQMLRFLREWNNRLAHKYYIASLARQSWCVTTCFLFSSSIDSLDHVRRYKGTSFTTYDKQFYFSSALSMSIIKIQCLWGAWRVPVLVACDLLMSVSAYTALLTCCQDSDSTTYVHEQIIHECWGDASWSVYIYMNSVFPYTHAKHFCMKPPKIFRLESCARMHNSCKGISPNTQNHLY